MLRGTACILLLASPATSFLVPPNSGHSQSTTTRSVVLSTSSPSTCEQNKESSRRSFLATSAAAVTVLVLSRTTNKGQMVEPAQALPMGPVKISLTPVSYSAAPCPPSRPIPGQMAMKGMRGLCVTVTADLNEASPKDLKDVGVYGFVVDGESGDSVLANNPDLSTDAGQFAMVESVTTSDKQIVFDFVAAVPYEKDIKSFENGIGPLEFQSLKLISFPGGQQFGAINPCEMNEFSDECEAWEAENGPYKRGEFMMKPNKRTMGR